MNGCMDRWRARHGYAIGSFKVISIHGSAQLAFEFVPVIFCNIEHKKNIEKLGLIWKVNF